MRKSKLHISAFIILLASWFAFTPSALAQDDFHALNDISGFKEKMNVASSTIQSINSDFVQLKHLSFLEEDVESKGMFFFQKENKLRWEYSDPFFYLIIFSNDTVLIQDDHKANIYDAASGRMFREINDIMLSMVNGSILESDNFTFEYFENTSAYKLELTPLDANMKEFLRTIRLFINKNDHTVDELYMIERSGDYTRIQFINKQLNEDIPQHTFDLP